MYEVHREEKDGYTIRIVQDEDAPCPWKDWDCEPSLAVYSDRDITEYGQYGDVNTAPALTREQILANKGMLFELLDVSSWFELRDRWYSDMTDTVNNRIDEALNDLNNSDRLEALCDLYNAVGIPAVCKSIRGYSQGDYAEVLAVATPEFQKACGNASDYDWHKGLEGSIQLFADWCYGNVYGYIVEDSEGEEIASCYGFYGDYDAPYVALHEAESAVNWEVAQNKKRHLEQVKTWIKNRVPLYARREAI